MKRAIRFYAKHYGMIARFRVCQSLDELFVYIYKREGLFKVRTMVFTFPMGVLNLSSREIGDNLEWCGKEISKFYRESV